ncbi:fatty-acid amide hydrolase 2-B-like [Osmia bicornis bicornis]|uniref:fatty-acid amide hydrolase 2-B-like n=1 Tax=Osmia bicornis bicornis TaxID=1437191 RepID=UPI0010F6BDC2|nr:fatty-acid amide hydrolase 2-B-like [Osmia bicornis bicornis]XP_029052187.1 fatty-acid amide hydrolase 2-B-like [Osmia bicornis bicornis]
MNEFVAKFCIMNFHLMHFIIRPFYVLIYRNKPRDIPSIKNPLLKLSATVLARKIRNRELSSQAVVEAYIERIKEVDPFINAVIEERFEAALNEAKTCDEKLKNEEVIALDLEKEKPLYGVPVTMKESMSVKGMSITGGCVKRKGFKAEEDGDAVKLIKNAGAIVLVVSNTSELCTAVNSYNHLFGQTKNPYNRTRTSGGSSGGEGALIASGASVLGFGSDIVGSIRIPALCNGIFGHKPTPGIIPIKGHYPIMDDENFNNFLVLGPLARYAEDLQLVMKVFTSRLEKPLCFDKPLDLKNLRIFYVDNFDSFCNMRSATSDIKETIHKALSFFAKNGAYVEHLSQEWIADTLYMQLSVFGELDIPELLVDPKNPEGKRRPFLEFAKSLVHLSDYTSTLAFVRIIIKLHGGITRSGIESYKNIRTELRHKVNNMLKDDAVFIYPTFPFAATYPELVFFNFDCSVYSSLANLLHLPSTHIPMGLNNDGLPIGFQVTAASYQDHLSIGVAKELEKAFGGWIPPS